MIVKLNGNYWFDTEKRELGELAIFKKSNKLRSFAIGLWTISGMAITQTVHAQSFYDSMRPLTEVFQDIALGMGILFALAGFILLGFKRRAGTATLKTTAMVVGGVFLVPSILMLVAIIGTMLNEALVEAFQGVRDGVGKE